MKKNALVAMVLMFSSAQPLLGVIGAGVCNLPPTSTTDQSEIENAGSDGYIQIAGTFSSYNDSPAEIGKSEKLYIYNYCDGPETTPYEFNLNAVLPKFENCPSGTCLGKYIYYIDNKPGATQPNEDTGTPGFSFFSPCSGQSTSSKRSDWVCLSERLLLKKYSGQTWRIKRCPYSSGADSEFTGTKQFCTSAATTDKHFVMNLKLNYVGRNYGVPKKQEIILNLPTSASENELKVEIPLKTSANPEFNQGVVPSGHVALAQANCGICLASSKSCTDAFGLYPWCKQNYFAGHNFQVNGYQGVPSSNIQVFTSRLEIDYEKPWELYNLRAPVTMPLATVMSNEGLPSQLNADPFADIREIKFYSNFVSPQYDSLTMVWNSDDEYIPVISPLDFDVQLYQCNPSSNPSNWAPPTGPCTQMQNNIGARITATKQGRGILLSTTQGGTMAMDFTDSGSVQAPEWYKVTVSTQPSVAGVDLNFGVTQSDGSQQVTTAGSGGFQPYSATFAIAVLPMPAFNGSGSNNNLPLSGLISNLSETNLQYLQTRVSGFLGLETEVTNSQTLKNILINTLRGSEYSPDAGSQPGTNTLSGSSQVMDVFGGKVQAQMAVKMGWTTPILPKFGEQFIPVPFGYDAATNVSMYRATWIRTSQSYTNALATRAAICSPEVNYQVSFTQSMFDTSYDYSTSSGYDSSNSASTGVSTTAEGGSSISAKSCSSHSTIIKASPGASFKDFLGIDASAGVDNDTNFSSGSCTPTGFQSSWNNSDSTAVQNEMTASSSTQQTSDSASSNTIGERRIYESREALLTTDTKILYGPGAGAWFSALENLPQATYGEYQQQLLPGMIPATPIPFRSWQNTVATENMRNVLNLKLVLINDGLNLNGESNNNLPYQNGTVLLVPELTSNGYSTNLFSYQPEALNWSKAVQDGGVEKTYSDLTNHFHQLTTGYRAFLTRFTDLSQATGGPLFAINDYRANYRPYGENQYCIGQDIGLQIGAVVGVISQDLKQDPQTGSLKLAPQADSCCMNGKSTCAVSNIPSTSNISQSDYSCLYVNNANKCLINTISHNFVTPPSAPPAWEFAIKPCSGSPCNFGSTGQQTPDFPQYFGFPVGRVPLFSSGNTSQVFKSVSAACFL